MSIAGAKSSGTAVTQVGVFTDEPYTGNPAGVCILDHSRDDIWMSRVAREMACANTAFVQHRPDGDGLDLRWFTGGGIEVDLCGHATLATAMSSMSASSYPRISRPASIPAAAYSRPGDALAAGSRWIFRSRSPHPPSRRLGDRIKLTCERELSLSRPLITIWLEVRVLLPVFPKAPNWRGSCTTAWSLRSLIRGSRDILAYFSLAELHIG
jgi:hypothetical protein